MSDDSRPLSTMERAVLAAALISAGAGALPILGRISGPGGQRLAAEAACLLALDQTARARRLAGLMARACALEPAGAALIHPEWLAGQAGHNGHEGMAEAHAIMARLPYVQAGSSACSAWDAPPATGAAMSAAGAAPPAGPDRHDVSAVLVWLRRTIHAELVDMPVRPHTGDGLLAAADLPLIAPERLQAGLGRLGRRQLAWALTAALPRDAAAVAAGLGEPEGSRLIAELAVLAAADPAEQTRAHGPVRAAILRMSDLTPGTGELDWERAGARAMAPRVAAAGGDLAHQIAQRLPRQVGQVVLAELLGPHREQPPEHGASVDALLACLP